MTGPNDSSRENSNEPSAVSSSDAVLGPVAAKGPKRFAAMPDLSKIPESARARLAQFRQDGPAWGASSTDARSLGITSNEDEIALDASPLGVPTPHVQIPHSQDPVSPVPETLPSEPSEHDEVTDQNGDSRSSVSDFSGADFLDDDDDEFELPLSPDCAELELDAAEHSSMFGAASSLLTSEAEESAISAESSLSTDALTTRTPAEDTTAPAEPSERSAPAAIATSEERNAAQRTSPLEAPVNRSFDVASRSNVTAQSGVTAQVDAAKQVNATEQWSDGVPLPDEPEPYWDDYSDFGSVPAPSCDSAQFSSAASKPVAAVPAQPMPIAPNSGAAPRAVSSVHRDIPEQELRAQAEQHLQHLVGRPDVTLREDQWIAIKALVMDRSRALVVQRTGWGKSAVYFVATLLLRAQGDGPTIIISPLLALMRDQIAAAQRAGIKAATINSANITEWQEIHGKINAGEVDVLLCSPERLNNPSFRDEVLPRLAQDAGLVVIDEAHCISDWGHDFRPDYRRIKTLLQELQPGIPVLATTATANERVSTDIAEQLAVTARETLENVTVLRGGLDRESLHLAVVQLPDTPHRIAWLTDALSHLSGSGIVYCMTVSAAQEVTEQLRAAGLNVAAYTGRTDSDERAQLEIALKNNEVKALIATSALGMGFDKPDLTFVIHLGAPNSPIAYYQQVGRAGRGVAQASAVLLPGREDREIWEYFGSLAFPPEDQVREVIHLLEAAQHNGMGPVTVPQLESKVDLKRSRLETMLKVLDVDGAVRRVQGGWTATGQPWSYDAARYRRVEAARQAEQNAMLAYAASKECRVKFLRSQLDDPTLEADFRCGRCDNCGGINLPSSVSHDALSKTSAHIAQPGIEVPARKMWPSNMGVLGFEVKGRISPSEQASDGKAVARIDGLGWSNDLRELFSARTPDGPTPVRLRTAAVQILDTWSEARECEGVISVRSLARPLLVAHLSQGLAQYLKIPYIGEVGPINDAPAPRHDINSAMRLAGVARRLGLELSPQAAAGLTGRKVLLVDDYTESGWTLAVASRLLRQAGAAQVVPFVLSQN